MHGSESNLNYGNSGFVKSGIRMSRHLAKIFFVGESLYLRGPRSSWRVVTRPDNQASAAFAFFAPQGVLGLFSGTSERSYSGSLGPSIFPTRLGTLGTGPNKNQLT
ncbi:hypothetical protein Nepgr_032311 [Nepenthes gracilis]|uniref:Uncharacterized protein n=1 Tax=Nepenthes gracilis TaxID=150966 RepID=A0AAD3TIC9_NEPGR|nr:hypothetical protein Nepgr_032311 [Nepenthes gracilis]